MPTVEAVLNQRTGKYSYVKYKDTNVYLTAVNGNAVSIRLEGTTSVQTVHWTGPAVAIVRTGSDPASDFVLFRVQAAGQGGSGSGGHVSLADVVVTFQQRPGRTYYPTPVPFPVPHMPIIDVDADMDAPPAKT